MLGKHDEADAFIDLITSKKMAANQVNWFIRKVIASRFDKVTKGLTRLEPNCG